jgi:membrane-bound lytic murein transglycosylase A
LEVQGSGVAKFDDNSSIYLGYDNQNGHKYRSIGRYLVKRGDLKLEEVSLQSIKKWLQEHPKEIDEVLNHNNSMVFFSKREQGATGALGVELTPMRSVAVDRKYIGLGSMLYLSADLKDKSLNRVVFAEDTGGAIKGSVRADLFVGSTESALELAGRLNAPLNLWLLLPKKRVAGSDE